MGSLPGRDFSRPQHEHATRVPLATPRRYALIIEGVPRGDMPQCLPWEMVLLFEGVSTLGGVVPLLGLMSLLLRCPYGGQNVGGAVINL